MTLIDLHSCYTNVEGNMIESQEYSNFNIWRGISGFLCTILSTIVI